MDEQDKDKDAQDGADEVGTGRDAAPDPAPDQAEGEHSDDAADEASKQSYPASDAPAW